MSDAGLICGISGLPIEVGEEALAVWLVSSPYKRDGVVMSPIAEWYIRTPPMRVQLEEFARVEPKDEAMADLWVWGLQLDLVERTAGDNRYHEQAVKLGDTFEHYEQLIQEGRVYVRDLSKIDEARKLRAEDEAGMGPGVPTEKRVRAVLASGGGNRGFQASFLVGSAADHLIWVRCDGYRGDAADRKTLERVQKAMPQFATVITYWESHLALLVMPKPGRSSKHERGYYDSVRRHESYPDSSELATMVFRKDAWAAAAALGEKLLPKDNLQKLRTLLQTGKKVLAESDKWSAEIGRPGAFDFQAKMDDWFMCPPFRVGVQKHAHHLIRTDKWKPYATVLQELAAVEALARQIRTRWRPSCLANQIYNQRPEEKLWFAEVGALAQRKRKKR